MLDRMCQRYSQRPSSVMQVDDPLTALDFDFAVMVRGIKNEREQAEQARPKSVIESINTLYQRCKN